MRIYLQKIYKVYMRSYFMKEANYPEILSFENWDNYDYESVDFCGAQSYEEDHKNALEYQKLNGGVIYTEHNDEGQYTYLQKGKHYFDRLGYCVVKINRVLKGGLKENGNRNDTL